MGVRPQTEAFTMSKSRMTEEAALEAGREFIQLRRPGSPELDDPCRVELIKAEDTRNHFGKRVTWQLRFLWTHLPEGVVASPGWTEVFVDDLTGETWWFETNGKPTETTWRNPWLKNKLQK